MTNNNAAATCKEQLINILDKLQLPHDSFASGELDVHSPVDGSLLGSVALSTKSGTLDSIAAAEHAFKQWRMVPAPKRGELVRLFAEELRQHKEALGALVTLECGKIYQEGLGEVQEMIDICDFAVGLSRQLYGLTMPSERPGHKMAEYWHPAGVIGIISAFNFPVAVWAWNAALALICGNSMVWKPSEKTPLTAQVCQSLFQRAAERFGDAPEGLLEIIIGRADIGELLVEDRRVPVISATGSTRMGKDVGPRVAQRFGRCILELGGNNAMIVTASADLDLAVRAIVFSAVGTAGQRCTTLRRIIVHRDIYKDLLSRLLSAYKQIKVGDPFDETSHSGPLIDEVSFASMQAVLSKLTESGCKVYGGERLQIDGYPGGCYVHPAIVEVEPDNDLIKTETFAPILYIMAYDELDEALAMHNDVPQGLSSCIFTQNLQEAEIFLSARGSDCGIANVNIGPSGAEIGGAFGGEKETGGGRESGSDAWKSYMRRCTVTINYSKSLPLAQGIEFGIE